jgi:hypothetical protein
VGLDSHSAVVADHLAGHADVDWADASVEPTHLRLPAPPRCMTQPIGFNDSEQSQKVCRSVAWERLLASLTPVGPR